MLRLTVLLLVLANAMYFAWSQGLLAPWGIAPAQQSESQRLEQQIKPESLRILGKEETSRVETVLSGPRPLQECLQAGPLEEAQVALLKQMLGPWPDGSWLLEPGELRGQWVKFPAVDDGLRARLEDLRPVLNAKNLRPCR